MSCVPLDITTFMQSQPIRETGRDLTASAETSDILYVAFWSIKMLPNVKNDPLLRCTAKSRRSGWQQCKNPKAFGSRTVCRYHGAQRTKRHGKLNPNYKSGKYTKKALERSKKLGQTLRALEQLVEISYAQYAQFKLHEKQRTSAEIGREIKKKIDKLVEIHGVPSDSDQSIAE